MQAPIGSTLSSLDHFRLEQAAHHGRPRSRDLDARALAAVAHADDVDTDVLRRLEGLARNDVFQLQDRVGLAQVHGHDAVRDTLDDARHQLLRTCVEVLGDRLALFLTDLLKDDGLRVLRRDAAEFLGTDLHVHGVADPGLRVDLARRFFGDLERAAAFLDFRNDFLRLMDVVVAGLTVDMHVNVLGRPVHAFARLLQGRVDRVENGVFADAFFGFEHV